MGDIFVAVLKWLVKEARLPRFVWILLVTGVLFIAACIGIRILTSDEIVISKLQMANRAQERAIDAQEKAQAAFAKAQEERERMRTEINSRIDGLVEWLEKEKKRLRSGVSIFSGDPPRRAMEDRISAVQMDLRAAREKIWNQRTEDEKERKGAEKKGE